jgi:hypothetical protein
MPFRARNIIDALSIIKYIRVAIFTTFKDRSILDAVSNMPFMTRSLTDAVSNTYM